MDIKAILHRRKVDVKITAHFRLQCAWCKKEVECTGDELEGEQLWFKGPNSLVTVKDRMGPDRRKPILCNECYLIVEGLAADVGTQVTRDLHATFWRVLREG